MLLHWRRWDEQWLVFDDGSGQTHRVDTLTALALMLLEDGRPATTAALAAAIATELSLDATELADAAGRLGDVLQSLQGLGLVIALPA